MNTNAYRTRNLFKTTDQTKQFRLFTSNGYDVNEWKVVYLAVTEKLSSGRRKVYASSHS